jgi:hypothetical protein
MAGVVDLQMKATRNYAIYASKKIAGWRRPRVSEKPTAYA